MRVVITYLAVCIIPGMLLEIVFPNLYPIGSITCAVIFVTILVMSIKTIVEFEIIHVLTIGGSFRGILEPGFQIIPWGFLPWVEIWRYPKAVFSGEIREMKVYYKGDNKTLSKYAFSIKNAQIKLQFIEKLTETTLSNTGWRGMKKEEEPKNFNPKIEENPWYAELVDDVRTTLFTIGRYLGFDNLQNTPDMNLETLEKHIQRAKNIQDILEPDPNDRVNVKDTLRETLKKFGINPDSFLLTIGDLVLSAELQKELDQKFILEQAMENKIIEARTSAEVKLISEKAAIKVEVERILKAGKAKAEVEKIEISERQFAFAEALRDNLTIQDKQGKGMTIEVATLTAKLVANLYTNEQIIEMVGADGKGLDGFIERIAGIILTTFGKK